MKIFKSTSIFEFQNKYPTERACKQYLYDFKWLNGFSCTKCEHSESWGNTVELGKTCKKCRKMHSVTSDTIFHGINFSVLKAFYILFEMSSSTKSVSALQMARKYSVNVKTAWLFARKIRESFKSSNDYPVKNTNTQTNGTDSLIYVDEFEVGGYEKGMPGKNSKSKKRRMMMVVETTLEHKIKRVYGIKIQNYSGKELRKLFERHIKKGSTVTVDGWKGYNEMKNDYKILNDIEGMKQTTHPINRMIQQFKSWLRGIFHKSSHQHIESYLNAFSFRINRSQWKETCFHSAIMKALNHLPLTKKMIPNVYNYV